MVGLHEKLKEENDVQLDGNPECNALIIPGKWRQQSSTLPSDVPTVVVLKACAKVTPNQAIVGRISWATMLPVSHDSTV